MASIPDEDLVPYRHEYGNYTWTSPTGYTFEWTPFTPAIEMWKRAESHLRRAAERLAVVQSVTGFGLNDLEASHKEMLAKVKELAEDTVTSQQEARRCVEVLTRAHEDYARSNDASLAEYQRLTAVIDGVKAEQRAADDQAAKDEAAAESAQDKRVGFSFE